MRLFKAPLDICRSFRGGGHYIFSKPISIWDDARTENVGIIWELYSWCEIKCMSVRMSERKNVLRVFQAALAVIIGVNLQAILAQFKDVCVLWKADRLDLVSEEIH